MVLLEFNFRKCLITFHECVCVCICSDSASYLLLGYVILINCTVNLVVFCNKSVEKRRWSDCMERLCKYKPDMLIWNHFELNLFQFHLWRLTVRFKWSSIVGKIETIFFSFGKSVIITEKAFDYFIVYRHKVFVLPVYFVRKQISYLFIGSLVLRHSGIFLL